MVHLDLHGVKHEDVKRKVEAHILMLSQQNAYFTGYIITGQSTEMKRLVKEELSKHKWVQYADDLKPGRIFIAGC